MATPLLPEVLLRDRQLAAYYHVLNGDPEFADALRELFEDCAKLLGETQTGTSIIASKLIAFAKQWRLPGQDGESGHQYDDLQHSLRAWLFTHKVAPARLITGGRRSYWRPAPQEIVPNTPAPFEYDPHLQDPSWVRGRIESLTEGFRRELVEQAQTAEKQARDSGLRSIPSQHADEQDLERLARRLYLRVIKQMSWARIAEEEAASQPDEWRDLQSVRTTVRHWASRLGVPLPKLPRGRPPGRKK